MSRVTEPPTATATRRELSPVYLGAGVSQHVAGDAGRPLPIVPPPR